jgi:hypothetical protein
LTAAAPRAHSSYPLYLLLSLVNQLIRRVTCRLKPGEKGFLLTPAARVTLAELREWEWAGVLIKMCYMGLIFWWGLVFTLPTYMLLSSVREWLIAQGGCGLASGIIFLIGAVLFLLPPVPGAAIYLVGGMILPDEQICGKTFADDEASNAPSPPALQPPHAPTAVALRQEVPPSRAQPVAHGLEGVLGRRPGR